MRKRGSATRREVIPGDDVTERAGPDDESGPAMRAAVEGPTWSPSGGRDSHDRHRAVPRHASDGEVHSDAATGWTGWVAFAGVMMIVMGAFDAIEGLVALFKDSYYVVRPSGLVVNVDYTAWGWVHLILGLVALAAGFGVLSGRTWARVVGIILAVVWALVNIAFIAAYPVWSMI